MGKDEGELLTQKNSASLQAVFSFLQLFGFVSFALLLAPACSCGRLGREAEEEGKKTVNYDLNGFERFSGTLRVSEGGSEE